MFADMHCDTLYKIREKRKNGQDQQLRDGAGLCVNLEKLQKSDCLVQNFAVFIDLKQTDSPYQDALGLADLFNREMEQNDTLIRQAVDAEEIRKNREEGRMSALLTLEEGGMCEGEIEKLHALYDRGARMMTLCWNYENELAYPAAAGSSAGGLKKKGFEFLEEMERIGMVADVSHLSDAGFFDVASACRKPFAASHSNARALCGHGRNLTDEMLRTLGQKGGVAGLNFYPLFLSEHPDPGEGLDWIARHACHMISKGGEECVGLGSDFDGFEGGSTPEDSGHIDELIRAFQKAGLTMRVIDGILWKNVMRLYREVL